MPILPPQSYSPHDILRTTPLLPTRNRGGKEKPLQEAVRHNLPDGDSVLVKRVIVAQKPELIAAFCKACAKELKTNQVLCFQRTLAKGEVIGLGSE